MVGRADELLSGFGGVVHLYSVFLFNMPFQNGMPLKGLVIFLFYQKTKNN
jgi:hypothetical protein